MEKMLYVVLCQYDGCEECSSGAHIVGVFDDKELADKAEKEHDLLKGAHLHSHNADAIPVELNKIKHKEF